MDRTSAQDVLRCDLCENNIAEMYCTLCPLNLCKSCAGEHLFDDSKKHLLIKNELRRTTVKYSNCGFHENEQCVLHCKDCDIHVCSKCIVSDDHERHKFVKVEEIYLLKQDVIKKDNEELEKVIYPSYEDIAADLEKEISDLDEYYDGLINDTIKQGVYLHRVVDQCTNRFKDEIVRMKRKHADVLKKNLEHIKQKMENIQINIIQNNKALDSKDFSKLFSYNSNCKEYKILPPKIISTYPLFLPHKLDESRFYAEFGALSPFALSENEKGFVLKKKEFLDEPIIITVLKTDFDYLENIACLRSEKLWVSGRSKVIECLNNEGRILQSCNIMSNKWPNDIAMTHDGNLAFIDGSIGRIFVVLNGESLEVIRLSDWTPLSFCFTSSNEVLVSMYNYSTTEAKVVRFSNFKEKQTIQFDDKGKPLYSQNSERCKYICENRNHDICVADYAGEAVVVVSETGKFRFRYTYQDPSLRLPYRPFGIATDSLSQILTADLSNSCIHIIDQNGHFLRYIANRKLLAPLGVCVDENDNVLVTDLVHGTVTIIRYIK